jgi:hypothetical protein
MENLSREAILRMVGLHDAAHMMRQLNAIQLSLEEEQGQMVTYWTEIRKSEKEISLLAGRVSANETSIGQLQVTAQQITASVSSLTTTVNGHTEQIGQLTITSQNITASVSSLTTTVNGHTSSIGQLEITSNSISNRVTVIEGDYVKEAEISLMVKKDANGYISNALIKADIIDFTFTQSTNFNSGGQTVMNINSNGDLWISGEYKGGSITGQITVGTGTNKMYIQPNSSNGADLVGNSGGTEVLKLGFVAGEGTWSSITPALEMKYYAVGSLNFTATLKPYYLIIKNNTSGLEANIQADRMSIDGDIRATAFAIKSGSTIYTGVTRTVTIGSTTLTIKGGIITDVS